ncbi:reverse transcriptase domain-containing protein [Tanacetum coccineum]
MKASIVFPPLSMEEASDDPLIIEAVMKGYLVRRVYMDQGASVEVMFEHCFENLSPAIRSRLRDTQMDLVGFAGGVVKPVGKIELEVVFGDRGLFRMVMINFTIVQCKNQLGALLKKSMDVFAWESADITGIPIRILEHSLNVNPSVEPVAQKRRVMASDRTSVVNNEVEEWVSAGIVRPMAQEDEEKTTFYIDQGTYCYTKMPFGLKNASATYQRLVDTAFQSQIGRNLKAYVDDMVIKSNNEKVLIEDIVMTFDNLWRINIKLNPKKCSFRVVEGKERDAEPEWQASGIKKILVPIC